jgi:hypothetical protein
VRSVNTHDFDYPKLLLFGYAALCDRDLVIIRPQKRFGLGSRDAPCRGTAIVFERISRSCSLLEIIGNNSQAPGTATFVARNAREQQMGCAYAVHMRILTRTLVKRLSSSTVSGIGCLGALRMLPVRA